MVETSSDVFVYSEQYSPISISFLWLFLWKYGVFLRCFMVFIRNLTRICEYLASELRHKSKMTQIKTNWKPTTVLRKDKLLDSLNYLELEEFNSNRYNYEVEK